LNKQGVRSERDEITPFASVNALAVLQMLAIVASPISLAPGYIRGGRLA
jgi:hypothetical protein